MLKTRLLHPEILAALGGAGHGAQVLIADGNYPLATHSNPAARRVFLNLEPGKLTVIDVLDAIRESISVEAVHVMGPDDGTEPIIHADFRELLPDNELVRVGRFAFYEMARSPDCALAIATGEQRTYSNILITIGVVHRG
ncbi:MAG: RbsD/FucU domain-containing protein [Chloroflexota bacterium]